MVKDPHPMAKEQHLMGKDLDQDQDQDQEHMAKEQHLMGKDLDHLVRDQGLMVKVLEPMERLVLTEKQAVAKVKQAILMEEQADTLNRAEADTPSKPEAET